MATVNWSSLTKSWSLPRSVSPPSAPACPVSKSTSPATAWRTSSRVTPAASPPSWTDCWPIPMRGGSKRATPKRRWPGSPGSSSPRATSRPSASRRLMPGTRPANPRRCRDVSGNVPASPQPSKELYTANTPADFWRVLTDPQPSAVDWTAAIRAAAVQLPEAARADDIDSLLFLTLGVGQFGPHHWQLSPATRLYYLVKPALPRWSTRLLRRAHRRSARSTFALGWPTEARYAQFQWEVARALLGRTRQRALPFIHFWP